MTVNADGDTLFRAHGFVPVSVRRDEDGMHVKIPTGSEVDLTFAGELTPEVRGFMEDALGIELGEVVMNGRLKGDLGNTRGFVQAKASRIVLPELGPSIRPAIEDLNLDLVLGEDAVNLRKLGLKLNGQPLEITARIPAPHGWAAALRRPVTEILANARATHSFPKTTRWASSTASSPAVSRKRASERGPAAWSPG
jgi:hypothetical protein